MRIESLEANLLQEYSEILLEIENLDPDNFEQSESDNFENICFNTTSEAKHFLLAHKQDAIVKVQNCSIDSSNNSRSCSKIPKCQISDYRIAEIWDVVRI